MSSKSVALREECNQVFCNNSIALNDMNEKIKQAELENSMDQKVDGTSIAVNKQFYIGLVRGYVELRCFNTREHKVSIQAVVDAMKIHFTKEELAVLFR
jgi:hypothetical protein